MNKKQIPRVIIVTLEAQEALATLPSHCSKARLLAQFNLIAPTRKWESVYFKTSKGAHPHVDTQTLSIKVIILCRLYNEAMEDLDSIVDTWTGKKVTGGIANA